MKPLIAVLALVLFAPSALAVSMRATARLDLRAAASPTGRVLAVVPGGTLLNVSSCAGEWCRATFAGKSGFVSWKLLATPTVQPAARAAVSEVFYENCTAARAAGAAPIMRGEPGYRSRLDRDDDGIACE